MPENLSYKKISLEGQSMWPILKEGDKLLYTEPLNGVSEGDLVLFNDREAKELVTHRIIRKEPLITKGDFACFEDKELSIEEIIGKIVGVRRGNKEIFWGTKGHILKGVSAQFCVLSGGPKYIRYIALFFLFTISKIVFLTTDSHTLVRL